MIDPEAVAATGGIGAPKQQVVLELTEEVWRVRPLSPPALTPLLLLKRARGG